MATASIKKSEESEGITMLRSVIVLFCQSTSTAVLRLRSRPVEKCRTFLAEPVENSQRLFRSGEIHPETKPPDFVKYPLTLMNLFRARFLVLCG